MPLPRYNYETPDRGMSSGPDFLRRKGYLRDSPNCRFAPGIGAISRNGSNLIANIAALDSSIEYEFASIGDHLIAVGDTIDTAGTLDIKAFNGSGQAITIYRQATLAFEGGLVEIEIGDSIQGATSGATGVVTGVTVDSGDWGGTDAAQGTLTIRHTSPGTDWLGNEDIERVGIVSTTLANVPSGETQDEVGNDYLGTDVANIRLFAIEDSVFVLNVDQVVDTLAAPTGEVFKTLVDYDRLINRASTEVGQIYKLTLTALGNPAGYYLTTSGSGTGTPPDPPGEYRRIPKPGQEDAYYDPATMPHRLLRISNTVYEWQQLPWAPRLSGGDVDGTDSQGEPIIRNPAVLKDRRILALTIWNARLVLALDDKRLVLSVARDFYNLWLDDVLEIKPNDRIVDELIAPGSGTYLYLEPSGDGLFISCEFVQAQFSARGGGILTAGGPDGTYNGRIDVRSRFTADADVAPVSWGGIVAMVDAQKYVRIFHWVGDQGDFNFVPGKTLNQVVIEDFVKTTPTLMRVANNHLYVLTEEGRAWLFQAFGADRDGSLIAAATYIQLDEPIAYLWGYTDHIRFITTYEDGFSLLSHYDQERVPEDRFEIVPRLDRIEEVEGVYDQVEHETAFTLQTAPTVDETRMFLMHDLVMLNFRGGVEEIIVGDVVTGGTSGATGTVYRISSVGEWGRVPLVGGAAMIFNVTVANGADLEAVRGGVNAYLIDDADEGIVDARFGLFNNASNGPIALCFTLRWPTTTGSHSDTPPEITSPAYLTIRARLAALLEQTEAQVCIAAGRLMIGFFNEIGGGPGTFLSDADNTRGLALATDLRAYIVANVTNGSLIRFHTAGITNAKIVHPDFVAEGSQQITRQRWFRQWIQWAKDTGSYIDVHLNSESVEEAIERMEAIKQYALSIGWSDYKWLSNEFGPADFPDQSDLDGAEAMERAMWAAAYSYQPYHLMRNPFLPQPGVGPKYVWCSVVSDVVGTRREPFATIVEDQLAITTAEDSASGVLLISRTGATAFESDEALLVAGLQSASLNGDESVLGARGDQITPTRVAGSAVYFAGDFGPKSADAGTVNVAHMIGRIVQARIVFPSQWAGMSKDRILITSISSFHDRTTDYEVVLTERGSTVERRYEFTAKVLGVMRHGETAVESGVFEFGGGADGRRLTLAVESNTPGTFRISGLEIEYERAQF